MKTLSRVFIGPALLLVLAFTVSCESMLDDLAYDITSLKQQAMVILKGKPLPQIALLYEGRPVAAGELIDMGYTLEDTPKQIAITIRNTGFTDVTVAGVSMSGRYANRFSAVTADALPRVLDSGSNRDMTATVIFSSAVPNDGYKAATISIDTGDDFAPFNVTVACERAEIPQARIEVWHEDTLMADEKICDFGSAERWDFTIFNKGTMDLTINDIFLNYGTAFRLPLPNPGTIVPGSSVKVRVNFEPDFAGTYTDSLSIDYFDGVDSNIMNLNLLGTILEVPVPKIHLRREGTELDLDALGPVVFANQLFENSSEWVEFEIYNGDTGDLLISSLTLDDTNNFDYLGSTGNISVLSGDSYYFSVRYHPSVLSADTPPHSTTITIEHNDASEETINLVLEGYYNTGQIRVNSDIVEQTNGSSYDFNGQDYRIEGAEHPFTITNTGSGDLIITNLVLSNSTNFSKSPASTTGTVGAGDSITFNLSYKPQTVGTHNATVYIYTNDPGNRTFVLNLTGHSLQPKIQITSPQGTDFGKMGADGDYDTPSGRQCRGKTFTITNIGDAPNLPLEIVSTTESGSNPDDFDLDTTSLDTELYPGESTTFSIRFDPLSVGTKTASYTIAHNDPTIGSSMLAVAGTGVEAQITMHIVTTQFRCVWEYDGDDDTDIWPNLDGEFGGPGIELEWMIQAHYYPIDYAQEGQNLGQCAVNYITLKSTGGNGAGYYTGEAPFMDSASYTLPKLGSDGIAIMVGVLDRDEEDSDLLSNVSSPGITPWRIYYDESSNQFHCSYDNGEEKSLDVGGALKNYLPMNATDTVAFRTYRGPTGSGDGEVWIYFDFTINDVTTYD